MIGPVHTQVESRFGGGTGFSCLEAGPIPAVSVGERRGFTSSWVGDALDVSIKNAIECLLVFTVCFLSCCFPGMSEFLSVRHRGERLADDETVEFVCSGGEPGALGRGERDRHRVVVFCVVG